MSTVSKNRRFNQQILINPDITIADIEKMSQHSMVAHLGIIFTDIGSDYLIAKMPVDYRTTQPMGILHGGASVTLAETLGSIAAHLSIDNKKYAAVGLEINANHTSSVSEGFVYGKAKSIHIGRSTQVWEIKITSENQKLVCVSRITMAIIEKR